MVRDRRMRRWCGAIGLAALVLASGGCGSAGSDGSSTTHAKGGEPGAVGFADPGSEIADGLVVPEGARMAGTVFARPGATDGVDDWSAYLVVDGDPFAVWDDLAAQLRNGGTATEMAGSADACTWMLADDAVIPGEGAPLEPMPVQTDPGAPVTTTEPPPAVDPYLAAITITAAAPTTEIDGVECSAAATTTAADGGAAKRTTMLLRAGARWPATVTIESSGGDQVSSPPTAARTSLERQARQGGGPDLVPGPDPVPEGAAAHVPEWAEQPAPEAGGRFGTEVNCFVGKGYEQLVLPPGASFVAGSFDEGSVSILQVDDVEAAVADIQEQTAGDGTSEDGAGTVESLPLADGGEVTDFSFGISAGGGGCGATSSADGRFLLVSVHGD